MKSRIGRFYLKKISFPIRRFVSRRSKFFWFSLILFAALSLAVFQFAIYASDLIYESDLEAGVPLFYLQAALFIPAEILLFLVFFSVKIMADVLLKREGVMLRFRLIRYFFLVTFIPSLCYLLMVNFLLNEAVEVLFQPRIVDAVGGSLEVLRENVAGLKSQTTGELKRLADVEIQKKQGIPQFLPTIEASLISNASVDWLVLFQSNKIISKVSNQEETRKVRRTLAGLNPVLLFDSNSQVFNTYLMPDNLVIAVIPLGGDFYLAGFKHPPVETGNRIRSTVEAVTAMKQFQILKEPIKKSLLIVYLYFFIPILAVGLLFIYIKSQSISKPVGELSAAARRIGQGDFSVRLKPSGDDEIRALVDSFRVMAKELMVNRIRLTQASHLEAWKEVAVKLAHEIKNPLTPVLLAVEKVEKEIMRRDMQTYFELNDSFNLIKQSVDDIGSLVTDFSKFSRDITAEKILCDVDEILNRVRSELAHLPVIESKVIADAPGRTAVIDSKKMGQVLTNLIQNAADSLLGADVESPEINLSSVFHRTEKGRLWILKVEDNGPGITEEARDKIFEPYFTTKKKGTGLGLSICERIIAAHGGRLWFESEPGRTVFIMEIPADGA